jgi:DNA-binding MarR family transcriptional regulator
MDSIALRVQQFATPEQVLVLARLAEARSESGRFGPSDMDRLFDDLGLPRPAKVSNVLASLEVRGFVGRLKAGRGTWRLTPSGRAKSSELADEMDMALLSAEALAEQAPSLGNAPHPLIPPWMAPPDLLPALRTFLRDHPFDFNVFGMTRFPDQQDESSSDPLHDALEVARRACADHGLQFHLASDRMIVDELWNNVAAHMWGCRYGIAFFEDSRGHGINYNLTIEVGGMLLSGRRLALLKDRSIERLPIDLVGHIYKDVHLDDLDSIALALHVWLRDDLRLGACGRCVA